MAKWHQKASVQTAIVTSLVAAVISLCSGMFYLYKENVQLKVNIQSEIESGVESFIKEVMRADMLANEVNLKPELMTEQETSETLNRINKEATIISNTVNLIKIHRLIKKYGKDETFTKFGALVNSSSSAHKSLLDFVISVSKKHDRLKRLDDIDYVNKIYNDYVVLINERNNQRGELHTFIVNLTLDDFKI